MLPPNPSAMIQNYNSSLPPHYPGGSGLLPTMVKPKSRFDSRGRFQTATVTTPTNGMGLPPAISARIPGREAQSAMMMQRELLRDNDSDFKMTPNNLTTRVHTAQVRTLVTGRNNLNSKSALNNNQSDAPKRSSSIYRVNLGQDAGPYKKQSVVPAPIFDQGMRPESVGSSSIAART